MWKYIELFDGYEVSENGEVRSLDKTIERKDGSKYLRKGRTLKKIVGKDDYYFVHLSSQGRTKLMSVARLVCTAFHENPNNLPMVDHIDGNKKNNAASNLRWADAKMNKNNPNTRSNGMREKGEYKCSDETKEKIRMAMLGRKSPRKGAVLSAETKTKISESRKGKVGRKRGVLQFDLDGNLLYDWDNISEAIRQNNLIVGAANPSITRCCQGELKQAYGYVWKYKAIK